MIMMRLIRQLLYQYVVDEVITWKGNPESRLYMSFLVRFLDGDEVWLPYSKDLYDTEQFIAFCDKWAPLVPLRFFRKEWLTFCRVEDAKPIKLLRPNMSCYVDQRAWGSEWFIWCDLPDWQQTLYVVKCDALRYDNSTSTRLVLKADIFDQTFIWKNSDVIRYGNYKTLSSSMKLVDEALVVKYPKLLKEQAD